MRGDGKGEDGDYMVYRGVGSEDYNVLRVIKGGGAYSKGIK